MQETGEFYTYLWLREDGTPYYVGKGKDYRGFKSNGHAVPRPVDTRRILIQEFPTEADSLVAEIFLISYYGRLDVGTGCLRNRTGGGDGSSGWVMPQTVRDKIRKRAIGRKHSSLTRAKMKGKRGPKASGHLYGIANPAARLTAESVEQIRTLYAGSEHTYVSLAAQYGVSKGCINHILNNRSWTQEIL